MQPRFSNTPDSDLLGRGPQVAALCNLLEHATGPLSISIDGPWGSGKSFLLNLVADELRRRFTEHQPIVLHDAWQSDYSEDPFASLVGDLLPQMHAAAKLRGRAIDSPKLIKASIGVMQVVIGATLKGALGIASAGLLDSDKVSDAISDAVKTGTDSTATKLSTEFSAWIEKLALGRKTVVEFKRYLSEFASNTTAAVLDSKGLEVRPPSSAPVVVIVDELDRCRPPHAIALLERIKHLFSVPNIAFIFAINRAELCNSIRAVYGAQFDADRYLHRFFDLEIRLDRVPQEKLLKWALDASCDRLGVVQMPVQGPDFTTLEIAIHASNAAARDVEQIAQKFVALQKTIDEGTRKKCGELLALAIALLHSDRELLSDLSGIDQRNFSSAFNRLLEPLKAQSLMDSQSLELYISVAGCFSVRTNRPDDWIPESNLGGHASGETLATRRAHFLSLLRNYLGSDYGIRRRTDDLSLAILKAKSFSN